MAYNGVFPKHKKLNRVGFCGNFKHERCNFNCVYCNQAEMMEQIQFLPETADTIIDVLHKMEPIFDPESMILGYAAAEITLSPYCDEILDFIGEHKWRTTLSTNGSIYNEKIARLIKDGTAEVIISIDAGTRETFKRVRGVDLFDKVIANCKRYVRESGKRIMLQYIVADGINDSETDLRNFVDIVFDVDADFFVTADVTELLTREMSDNKIAAYLYLIREISKFTEVKFGNWRNQMYRRDIPDVRFAGDKELFRAHKRIDAEISDAHKRIDAENKLLHGRMDDFDKDAVRIRQQMSENIAALEQELQHVRYLTSIRSIARRLFRIK
jgi:MoaA/NifB/PqqE/SkfB family radical SAM enzyme